MKKKNNYSFSVDVKLMETFRELLKINFSNSSAVVEDLIKKWVRKHKTDKNETDMEN